MNVKSFRRLAVVFGLVLSAHAHAAAQESVLRPELKTVTLYGSLQYKDDFSRALFSFKTGAFGKNWDLYYGGLRVSEEWDWFQVSGLEGARSAFRDLGPLGWDDSFTVPVIEPFPKLKPGERRHVTIDASGADGEDGARGADGEDGEDGDGAVRHKNRATPEPPPATPRRPKRDGVPKVDPVFVKAVVGHMYVIRVVDEENDFYVLFRVEALVRGDNCTISWKRIPAPAADPGAR